MNTPIANSVVRNVALPRPGDRKARARWRLNAYRVMRRDRRDVRTYRSLVYSAWEESAELGIGLSPDEVARPAASRWFEQMGASRPVQPEELVDFWECLGVTLQSGSHEGVALVRATRMAVTPRMRGILGRLRWRLSQGAKLHQALGEFPEEFGSEQIALAEAGGELAPPERAALYLSLSGTLREQASRTRRFWSTMLDQVITMIMLAALSVVTLVCFIPNYTRMFASMEVSLPKPYQFAAGLGSLLREYWIVSLPVGVGAVIASVAAGRWLVKTPRWQRAIARLPGIGPVVRSLSLARALPVFAILHKAAVPPRTNFRLAAGAAGNALVAEFFRAVSLRCEEGMSMDQAFMAERLKLGLSDGRRLAGKIEAGGELGDLENVLNGLAQEFSLRASTRVDALPKIIKPLNLAVMGAVVGAIAALVGMPSMLVLEKTLQRQNFEGRQRIERQVPSQAPAHH